jgi:hypothetical protein
MIAFLQGIAGRYGSMRELWAPSGRRATPGPGAMWALIAQDGTILAQSG